MHLRDAGSGAHKLKTDLVNGIGLNSRINQLRNKLAFEVLMNIIVNHAHRPECEKTASTSSTNFFAPTLRALDRAASKSSIHVKLILI